MLVKITAIKFEVVNGKKVGRLFDFKLDPKKMAVHKTEATVKKKVDEYVVKSGFFKKEELKDIRYDMSEFLQEWKKQKSVVEAELLKELDASTNNPQSRVTPQHISRLAGNEVFVFGSNAQGLHYGGAAKVAVLNFGAVMGQGHGLQGKSYAINSMSGIPDMEKDVRLFCEFARQNPQMHFLVTPIGCGIAGYSPREIAPLFQACKELDNVSLPKSFWDVIGMIQSRVFDLDRFVNAQTHSYNIALSEIMNGQKQSHWIWYIFPQRKGLGRSYNSKYYGLDGVEEAAAYLAHPVLGARLREISEALLAHRGQRDIDVIMGSHIDVVKLQSCMNLFNKVSPNDIFRQVLDAFF